MLVFLKKKEVKLILIYFVKLDRSKIFLLNPVWEMTNEEFIFFFSSSAWPLKSIMHFILTAHLSGGWWWQLSS